MASSACAFSGRVLLPSQQTHRGSAPITLGRRASTQGELILLVAFWKSIYFMLYVLQQVEKGFRHLPRSRAQGRGYGQSIC